METLSKSFERAKSNMGGLNIYHKDGPMDRVATTTH
jgi:hypothetical protein